MLGSDPVWPVDQLDRWDEADSGWQNFAGESNSGGMGSLGDQLKQALAKQQKGK